MSELNKAARDAYWVKTRNLTIGILIVWFFFSFVVHFFAQGLNEVIIFGFPMGYYFAAQGSLIVFVVLIFFQNWRQDSLDDEFGFGEE
jgi:putative solute:sodium symporter small subunit